MTLRCAVHATLDENVASDESGGVAVIERNLPLAPETLGLTLTEGHALLHNIQAQLVTAQVAAWQAGRRPLSRLRRTSSAEGSQADRDAHHLRHAGDRGRTAATLRVRR